MHVRPYRPEDAIAVDQLIARRTVFDGREALSEHKALRVGVSGEHEAVGETAGHVVAYGHAAFHPEAAGGGHWATEVVVAPTREDATAIVGRMVTALRDRVPADERVTFWAWREDDVAAAADQSWPLVRELHQMGIALPCDPPGDVAAGIEIRSFRRGIDEEAWIDANRRAFVGHPENGAVDRRNLEVRLDQSWFDPAGFLLAWRGKDLVGYCWTKLHPERIGEIYIIGVVPEAQGLGLGTMLLRAGLDDLAGRGGATCGILYVGGDDVRALRLYEKFGFVVRFTNREFDVPARAAQPKRWRQEGQ